MALVESGELKGSVAEELSQHGRNAGDVIRTCEWFDAHGVNLGVKSIGKSLVLMAMLTLLGR